MKARELSLHSNGDEWFGGPLVSSAVTLLDIPMKEVHPLGSLTAFALLILCALLRSGPHVESDHRPGRLVILWILAAATVLLWAGCVVALHSRGMPL
jgi:hypothetical protein